MAVKTITIDMEAYELLAADKREKESFSKVIRRRFGENSTAMRLLNNLDDICLSEDALDAAERVIASRAESPADSPVLDEE